MTEMASIEELQMSGISVAVAFLGGVFFDFWVVFFVVTLDLSVVVSTVVVGVNVGMVGSCVMSFKPEIKDKIRIHFCKFKLYYDYLFISYTYMQ